MYSVFFFFALLNLCTGEVEISKNGHRVELDHQNLNKFHYAAPKRIHNNTYIDKDENMLRLPALNYIDEHKLKKKFKKSPKRTIQKIIKKNKGKLHKVYFSQGQAPRLTKITTQKNIDIEKMYAADEMKKWKGETTTQIHHKHRNRNSKVVRYHMPFQKLQKTKEEKRHKRGLSRELFILKDLDQIEFLSKEKDKDIVKAHITNYWKV